MHDRTTKCTRYDRVRITTSSRGLIPKYLLVCAFRSYLAMIRGYYSPTFSEVEQVLLEDSLHFRRVP